jgi:small-conductance mechanosensitive channel
VPSLVLDWFALVPSTVVVIAYVVAVVGLLGIVAAAVVATVARGRVLSIVLGFVLLLAGLALFGLDPFPASIGALESWWPQAITQPQLVGSAYWTILALGVTLTGVGLLGTSLILAVTRDTRTSAR